MKKILYLVLIGVASIVFIIACTDAIELYKVTFDSQGGSSRTLQEVAKDMRVEEPAPPSREGYTFDGWYKETSLTNGWNFERDKVVKNTTLYAKWIANSDTAYIVEHYQQDGAAEYILKESEHLEGTTDEPVIAIPKSYTAFIENGGHNLRVASGIVAADGSLVLKLYYDKETYTVSFETEEGSAVEPLTGIFYDSTIEKPAEPTKDGYYLKGWYADTLFANKWNFESDTVIEDITLYAKWNKLYMINDIGPSGGYVFYDNPDYEADDWRYLEVAPAGWSGDEDDPKHIFGHYRISEEEDPLFVGTSTEIGSGKSNTEKLVAAMGDEAYRNFYVLDEKAIYAAKVAKDYRGGGFSDWFLPSKEEVREMRNNLYLRHPKEFTYSYWSSSEVSNMNAYYQITSDDSSFDSWRSALYAVRPVRAF